MTRSVVLGLDPSKTKIGWGLVDETDGSPIRADVAYVDGSPEGTRRALSDAAAWMAAHDIEPCLAYVEYPFGGRGGGHGIFESGVSVGYCEFAARMFWPRIALDRIDSRRWRNIVGVPSPPADLPARSTARRDWLKGQDVDLAQQLGFTLPIVGVRKRRPSDDAADGALIARAAWLALESDAPGSPQRETERTAA